jgi:uncharacterized protein (DUF427 family)
VSDYPTNPVPATHVEPVPRRIRAYLGGSAVVDSTNARYVWEWPAFPQYYIPAQDVRAGLLVNEDVTEDTPLGKVAVHGLSAGDGEAYRPAAAKVVVDPVVPELRETVRFEWSALDAWFEEDERVHVHPRSPYTRVDALRSTRHVRVELHGEVLAESSSPVLLFETGLPTRYYLNRTDVDFTHLVPSDTVTSCPYKGTTTGYWSARIGERTHPDVAWSYEFPLREVQPVAGLVAFYNEKVDIHLDGVALERPQTHFSKRDD